MNSKIANMIYISDPSDEIVEWANANLIMPNPEYAKKERMGLWLGRTPRQLQLFDWHGHTLVLPFGVCRDIIEMLKKGTIECDFHQDDEIDYGDPDIGLYDYQKKAVISMIASKYGILMAKPGSGKTQMGISLIMAHKRRALWLCHTADLLNQSRDRALRYIQKDLIGTITEGKVAIGEGVTFATVQTMSNLDLLQYRHCWDVVIVDECHRVAASASTFTRYEKVLNHLAARHKYGLTATPERSDGLIRATFALLGGITYEVPDEAVADRTMKVKIRPEDTATELTDDCLNTDGTINYVKLIEHITTDPQRNKQIARKIMEEKNHSCLILSERLTQLEEIRNLLPYEMQEKSAFINGKMQSKKAKAEREQALEDMRAGKKQYLFASYSLAKEGLDVPCLDRLFLASPAKFSAIVTQSVGRIQRTAPGKETPIVIDFVDREIGFCERAYKERCRSYRKIGAEIEKGFLK